MKRVAGKNSTLRVKNVQEVKREIGGCEKFIVVTDDLHENISMENDICFGEEKCA